jgi:Domain of unknown function (DUF4340)
MDMNEFVKTLTFVGVALLLTGAAFVGTREHSVRDAQFNDQGQPFFPEFTDPLQCTDLEVVSFDPATASSDRFRVMWKNNRWVIPAHYDYPADARDRLSKTAAAVMDLTKDTIRSDSVEDQQAMGVIDPLDSKVAALEGRGKRVTLRDASEKVLADFIIGNDIKGTERKGEGGSLKCIRVPGQKRTYGVAVKAELSTRFADWIETNLLKVDTGRIRKVVFDNYKMQEVQTRQGEHVLARVGNEKVTVTRKESFGPWSVATEKLDRESREWKPSPVPAGQEANEDRLRSLVDALGDLKIVGIRPKPPGVTNPDDPNLQVPPELIARSLVSRGFYPVPGQGIFSDQGEVLVSTDEGVVYTLRYGGPIFATGEELSAGTPDTAEKKDEADKAKKKDAEKKSQGTQESRFLMVTVSFDPSMIPKPGKDEKAETKPAMTDGFPDDVFAPDPKDPKYIADQKAAEEKEKRDKEEYDRKLADGEKKVKDLAARFGPWYYVTPGESFTQINLDSNTILRPKAPPGASPPPTGGFPGAGGFPGGLPGGHP